jgi:DNA-binding YbaB/EbfC family protein
VPATILSRCQRFDLKRVPAELLAEHFRKVTEAEGASAEPEALTLIARASEGSVRDGLSILDQAIAQAGAGAVTAEAVRDMLGLADRGRVSGLLGAILEADAQAALSALDSAHGAGVEPQALLAGLLDMVHGISRAKLSGMADPALPEADKVAVMGWAGQLGFSALHRLWQLLLKGHADVGQAPVPQQAAEMAVLRAVHAAGLPDPEKLAKLIADGSLPSGGGGQESAPARTRQQAPSAIAPPPAEPQSPAIPADAPGLVALFEDKREAMLAKHLRDDVAVAEVQPGLLRLAPVGQVPSSFAADVRRALEAWTGQGWTVSLDARPDGIESLRADCRARSGRRPRGSPGRPDGAGADERIPRCGAGGGEGGRRFRARAGQEECSCMKSLDEIIQMASNVQAELAKAQEGLDKLEVEGISGGGLVKVTASAKGRIIRLDIDPSLMTPESKEMTEDLIVAALNDARGRADQVANAEMQKMTAGLPLPPGFKL